MKRSKFILKMTLYSSEFLKFTPEILSLTIIVYTIKTIFIEYTSDIKS